ncbi:MAG: hypothetical protein GYA55_01760 [SAR324 cluster bacterium]|uniref:Uncharacterized protein n=1 Tax=SAR324 cluster bacterium TaxID=2024889 RepID=A0A7X9IJB3_9DELT|nr:hypothetical protein [SAR324 cluster bacterium]
MWICKCPDGPGYIGHCNQRLSSLNPTCGGFYPKAPAGSCYIGLECANDPENSFKNEGYRSGKCGGTVVTCPADNSCLNGTTSCSDPRICDIPEAAGGGTHSCVFPGLDLCRFETKPGEPIRPITDGRVFGCPESGSDCKTKDGKDGFIKCVEKPCWCQGCINALNIVCKVTCEPIESTPTPTPTSISTVTTTPQATATVTSTPIYEATVTPTPTVTPTITPTQCEGDSCSPCTPENCKPGCANYHDGCKGGSGDDAPKAFLVG